MFLTRAGQATAASSFALLVLAAYASNPGLATIATLGLCALCLAAFSASSQLGAVVMGRAQCTVRIEPEVRRRGLRTGERLRMCITVRTPGGRGLHGLAFHGVAAHGLRLYDTRGARQSVPAGQAREFVVGGVAERSGEMVVHGLFLQVADRLGLVRAENWMRLQVVVTVLPVSADLPSSGSPRMRASASEHGSGVRNPRGRDPTTEVRQLRAYRAGDPLRTIAWKATARRGQIIVRELETESAQDLRIWLDAGPGMRGTIGTGLPPFETAKGVVLTLTRQVLDAGGTVSVESFDGALLGELEGMRGPTASARVLEHLQLLSFPWDERHSDWTDDELALRVARYLRVHHGSALQVVADGRHGEVDARILTSVVASRYSAELESWRRRVVAAGLASEATTDLRRFARVRGLPEPWRRSFEGTDRSAFFESRLMRAGAARKRAPIVVLTDLGAVHDLARVRRAIAFATERGHRVIFALPFGPDDAGGADPADGRAVREAHAIAERDRRAEQLRVMRSGGAEVVWIEPGAAARLTAVLLHRLRGSARAFRVAGHRSA